MRDSGRIIHPRIYLDASGRMTDAIAIRHGRVIAIGSQALRYRDLPEIRPNGACLMPGLCDAHIHLWGLGMRAETVRLRGATSVEDVVARLGSARPTANGWILGTDWDDNRWEEGEAPTLAPLDRIAADQPICLRRVDGHAVWVNSVALALAGITSASEFGEGGYVVKDASGEPSGVLVDDAMNPVLELVADTSLEEDRAVFLKNCQMLLGWGITSAHPAWVSCSRLQMLRDLHQSGSLPLRIFAMLDGRDEELSASVPAPYHDEDGWLSYQTIKFFADGAMGSRGAELLDGYTDGSRGLAVESSEALVRDVPRLAQEGWQVAIHAIGDQALRRVLDVYELVSPRIRKSVRLRLEHAQMVHPRDIPRFATLDTIASIQPVHLRSDGVWLHRVIPEQHLSRLFPWSDLASYTTISAGSDFPIDDPNPWQGIATAMTRRTESGATFPGESLTRQQALEAYLSGAHYSGFQEHQLGKLLPGYLADWIAVDTDPFVESADGIARTQVLATAVQGAIV